MTPVRSFVAILLSEEVRGAVAGEIARLRPLAPRVSWVSSGNVHLTVKFLGEIPPEALEAVKQALGEAVVGVAPFRLRFRGLGAFPEGSRPRVLWVGVAEGGEAAEALHSRVEAALARRGFPREARRFSPHLTIGRVREPRGLGRLEEAISRDAGVDFGRLDVEELWLMRSDLAPTGARYTELARFRLAAP